MANADPAETAATPPSFEAVYARWFHEVCRWLRAFGVPGSDLDDVAQEVFIVVERKLPHWGGDNLPGWLYGVAWRTASDHRRRAWWRRLVFGRTAELSAAEATEASDPAVALERREAQQLVARILGRLAGPQRRALALFEIEGLTMVEIAALEAVPVSTVKMRLHHGREAFRRALAALTDECSR